MRNITKAIVVGTVLCMGVSMSHAAEATTGPVISIKADIEVYYDQVQELLPHSDSPTKDKTNYINAGRLWLQMCSAEIVFYGRYINEFNHSFIDRAFKKVKKDGAARI